jgi:tetraacyldisaccharide 4'-kinase
MAPGPGRSAAPPSAPPAGAALEARIRRLWFGPHGALDAAAGTLLRPLGVLVGAVAGGRRRAIARAKAAAREPGRPPVVVVGNLVVGGTGKTPLLIALVDALAARGWRPGVLARGYRSRAEREAPRRVGSSDDADAVGDEPLLVARRTGRPVVVGRDRGAALRLLATGGGCDVVLADDGLQHARLPRDLELAVFDERGAGNGRCLPAGPLREPLRGALLLDALVLNGHAAVAPIVHSRVFRFELVPTGLHALDGERRWTPAAFAAEVGGAPVDAIAGIGSPQRFFDTLAGLGLQARPHPLADHARIDPGWLAALPARWIVMTEKDAVKCARFDAAVRARCVALRVEAIADPALVDWLEDRLRG